MKYLIKTLFLLAGFFPGTIFLYAQDCTSGYCPESITVHHIAGDISPVTKDVTYDVLVDTWTSGVCSLDRALGASQSVIGASTGSQLALWSDYENYFGWYFQFGNKQGYYKSSSTSLNGTLLTSNDKNWNYVAVGDYWPTDEDPCTLTLGNQWRVADLAELTDPNYGNNYIYYAAINSGLIAQGYVNEGTTIDQDYDGSVSNPGMFVWSRNTSNTNTAYNWRGVSSNYYTGGTSWYTNVSTSQIWAMPVLCVMEY